MRFYKSSLSLFGLFLFVAGLVLNVLMFTLNWYPSYLFFIFMGAGLVFFLIDISIRIAKGLNRKTKVFLQIIVIVLPILIITIKTQIIDARAQVIIAPPNYNGPYIIVFGVKGKPKLSREGRDILIQLPSNGVVLTSTDIHDVPDLYETYLRNDRDKYGTRVIAEMGEAGQVVTANCKLTLNFEAGYYKKQGDTSSTSFDMNSFVDRVHDSLCRSYD